MSEHVVQFYESDAFLLDRVSSFMREGFKAGEAGLLIATRPHRLALDKQLKGGAGRKAGRQAAPGCGDYLWLDAADTLARCMVAGAPDRQRFAEVMAPAFDRAARLGNGRVRVFGDMVALLWESGERDAALQLEQLWNELLGQREFSLFCAYPMRGFEQAGDGEPLREVCHAHSQVCAPEGAAPLRQSGDLNGMVAMLQQKTRALETEIAKRIEAENALRNQLEKLAEVDRRKDEFLAMLGHELRNPMAPIVNALELMRLDACDAARMDRAREVIERQVKLMRRLLDDLLDVARLTNGAIEMQKEKVLLINLVERALNSTAALVDERGHRLALDIPDEQIVLHGDAARLGQALANLIHNAAKYTDVGGHIWVGARREGDELVLSVRDNGSGLDPELRERVFDMFVQGNDTLARSRGGLGIGLTLARKILQMHDGSIEAHSDGPGKGSEFVARMPIRGDNTGAASRAVTAHPGLAPGRPRKILVVDDNVDSAESLALLLRNFGHEVRVAGDGAAALEMARQMIPAIVILDIGLPKIDGYEVARRMRAMPALRASVLVALTGYAQKRDTLQAERAGFDHHFAKPLDLMQLQALLADPAGSVVPQSEGLRLQ